MDSLPPLSWAMCARCRTAREIRATKGQLLLQLLELFWDTAWWFMLANWFNSWADKQLFFFFFSLCPNAEMAFKIPFEKHVSLATVKKVHGWYTVTTSRNIWWCSSILTTASTNHLFCTVSSLWSWGFVLRRCLHFCRYFYTLILTGLLCPAALVVSVHVSICGAYVW